MANIKNQFSSPMSYRLHVTIFLVLAFLALRWFHLHVMVPARESLCEMGVCEASAEESNSLVFEAGSFGWFRDNVSLSVPKKEQRKAERLHKATSDHVVPGPTYKHTRAREMVQIATEMGFGDIAELSIAHALQECGILSHNCDWKPGSAKSDHGWAIGMYQWHMWYKHQEWVKSKGCAYYNPRSWDCPIGIAKLRELYFLEHPEMRDWRGQYVRYLIERGQMLRDDPYTAIRKWNWNAGDPYYYLVKGKLATVRSLLES